MLKMFKITKTIEERQIESRRIKDKYPNRIPIICGIHPSSAKDLPVLDKFKFLTPDTLTFGQFLYTIRRRLKLDEKKGLYIFTDDNTLCTISTPMKIIYAKHRSPDGFLYLQIHAENTFG
jgi:GABA(A) receptor-associated protein